jgi:maltooligosyltrehalose trehalohydrolase
MNPKTDPAKITRRLPIGAEVHGNEIHFRVWAPKHRRAEVVLLDASNTMTGTVEMEPEADGYFRATTIGQAGLRYAYRFDHAGRWYADPASRFQSDGPEGPSQVVDPRAFPWTDKHWTGTPAAGQVIYELHVGTFTQEGTWEAATRELAELARIGITLIEVLPVADFAGEFGWGYDGVNFFAPTRLYGSPDDFRRFVDAAHSLNLGVILDVVYNHFGPVGNYLREYADAYFADRYTNEWGAALNFDDDAAGPVREFFLTNARYWIEEFHIDGYRFDATHTIIDSSTEHILTAIVAEARRAAKGRETYFVAENQPQDVRHVQPPCDGGFGMVALWNDDFHHTSRVRATLRTEGYYKDYLGTPAEFVAAVKHGLLYQGQRSYQRRCHHGSPMRGYPAHALVNFLQNHDQVANSLWGERMHQITSPGRFRALTSLLLLAPQTPMLFQGQEFCASSPFQYFAHHDAELGKLVAEGRKQFLRQFPSLATVEAQAAVPDPGDRATFERCKLRLEERAQHVAAYKLHIDLLRLRRDDPVIRRHDVAHLDGTVLSEESLVIRFFSEDRNDRLLLINFGRDVHLSPIPEPLLATPAGCRWELLFGSESPHYGGQGIPPWEVEDGWRLAAESALLLHAVRNT